MGKKGSIYQNVQLFPSPHLLLYLCKSIPLVSDMRVDGSKWQTFQFWLKHLFKYSKLKSLWWAPFSLMNVSVRCACVDWISSCGRVCLWTFRLMSYSVTHNIVIKLTQINPNRVIKTKHMWLSMCVRMCTQTSWFLNVFLRTGWRGPIFTCTLPSAKNSISRKTVKSTPSPGCFSDTQTCTRTDIL